MKVISSAGGRIVVEHEDGYVFVFEVHDPQDLVLDIVESNWPIVGPPPDADDLELSARRVAEIEAKAQGWLW